MQAPFTSTMTSYKVVGTLINIYVIQSGDTLSAIADRLHISLDGVLAANPGVKPEDLEVGQVISCLLSRTAWSSR